jgi:hypothetical protein
MTIGTSLYGETKIEDFYLGLWVQPIIKKTDLDELFFITAKYHKRPDLLSYEKYGTPDYWWVFMLRNKDVLNDPIDDFVAGKNIYIPKVV